MITLFYICSSIYFLILILLTLGILFQKVPVSKTLKNISVIVSAKNEEKNIGKLLEALISQDYPKNNYEIIVVDDRSNDDTYKIIRHFEKLHDNLTSLQIFQEDKNLKGKKGAISKAISVSKYDILAFTDADCKPDKLWLSILNEHFTSKVDFVAGYSFLTFKSKFFSYLKNLERAALFAVISGSFGLGWKISCTGGNMAYRKQIFEQANGFSGIGHIRSGDDDLLLQKMRKFIRKVRFMFSPNSHVISSGNDKTNDKIQQETRRGSKWRYYTSEIKLLTLFVFLYYLFFALFIIYFIFGSISTSLFITLLAIKILPEFLILLSFLIKIKKTKLLSLFPIIELIYIPYFIIFGLKGTFGKYKWKQ